VCLCRCLLFVCVDWRDSSSPAGVAYVLYAGGREGVFVQVKHVHMMQVCLIKESYDAFMAACVENAFTGKVDTLCSLCHVTGWIAPFMLVVRCTVCILSWCRQESRLT
jgi:hypothetical protein